MTALALSEHTRLLVVAPHPDDETLGAGILIQQVVAAGGSVKLLLLTNGDNNPWPQRYMEHRLRIDAQARLRWGARRRAEVLRAIVQLGLSASALEAFDWPDMGLTLKLTHDAQASIRAISHVLEGFAPTVIVFPALADRHPDHSAAHVLCRLAMAGWNGAPDLLAFPVHTSNDAERYPVRIEGTEAQLRHKLAALSAYESQMALSGGRMRRMAHQNESYERVDDPSSRGRRAVLPWHPSALLRPWLRLLVATPSSVCDYSLRDAPLINTAGGRYTFADPQSGGHSAPCFVKLHLDWRSPWIFDHWGWHLL